MASRLDKVIDAHGGLERWNQLDRVHAHVIQDGVLWALNGHPGQLADVFVTADLDEQWVSHEPFGTLNLRSLYTPDQAIIEETSARPDESLESPRESFAGHTLETPWTDLQLVYFVSTSMWTYVTQPFTYALPGFETAEIESWDENGEGWRRLRVTWPVRPVGHSRIQKSTSATTDSSGASIMRSTSPGGLGGRTCSRNTHASQGSWVFARHIIFAREDQDNVMPDPLMVSISMDQAEFVERQRGSRRAAPRQKGVLDK